MEGHKVGVPTKADTFEDLKLVHKRDGACARVDDEHGLPSGAGEEVGQRRYVEAHLRGPGR